jgi:glucan phosphoethanolaminetransferase (alkaline phosphatase superfamily)
MVNKYKSILNFKKNTFRWSDLFLATILVCATYTFMEWLFIVTKPSSLNEAGFGTKFSVLIQSFLFFSAICLAPLLALFVLGNIFKRINGLVIKIGMIVPALVMAGLALLLIDNFTYTVFKFGISSTIGITRGIYGLLFLVLLFFSYRYLYQHLPFKNYYPKLNTAIYCLVILGVLISILSLNRNRIAYTAEINGTDKRPNILLIGSDGVNANNMSVYGYERDTTPNIKRFAEGALVVRNNFSNSSNTSGSLTSILTSKYPTETRLLYPPDILKGVDAYQHLPGILKQLGYYSVELGAPHFADAYTLGMLKGFDEVNGRYAADNIYFNLIDVGFTNDLAYFLSTVYDRIISRVLHIFYIAEMNNPYDLVTKSSNLISDQEKIAYIVDLFGEHKDQPIFVHAHLMGTHGPNFNPTVKKFSDGTVQDKSWDIDYYDDSIYTFDILFGKLIDKLKKKNLLDNTVIILYSDHGIGFNSNKRLPLIFKFPGVNFGGEDVNIGQNLDIAPTVLDYLGITIPDWMTGNSLLRNNDELIPIISTGAANTVNIDGEGWVQNELFNQPPFFQFDYINLIYCQQWFRLNLESYEWSSGEIENYDDPCPENKLLTPEQIFTIMSDRLRQDGFEIPEALNKIPASENEQK